MSNSVIYIGNDPNIKGMKCEVLNKKGDILTLATGDEILGRVVFNTHKSKVIKRG